MDNEAEVLSAIRRHVWAGTYDAGEIGLIVGEESFQPGQADHDWLQGRIEEAFREKRSDEATWPATTDCDRLDSVFETLEAQGIIVEQDAGLTKSDGLEIVTEAYEDAVTEGEGAGIVGYCYYHGQDLDRVMKSGDLWLAFGDFLGDDERRAEVGRRIQRALLAAGFAVEWSGSVWERILVRGFRWQRRSP